jgi:hypothetical protein
LARQSARRDAEKKFNSQSEANEALVAAMQANITAAYATAVQACKAAGAESGLQPSDDSDFSFDEASVLTAPAGLLHTSHHFVRTSHHFVRTLWYFVRTSYQFVRTL